MRLVYLLKSVFGVSSRQSKAKLVTPLSRAFVTYQRFSIKCQALSNLQTRQRFQYQIHTAYIPIPISSLQLSRCAAQRCIKLCLRWVLVSLSAIEASTMTLCLCQSWELYWPLIALLLICGLCFANPLPIDDISSTTLGISGKVIDTHTERIAVTITRYLPPRARPCFI